MRPTLTSCTGRLPFAMRRSLVNLGRSHLAPTGRRGENSSLRPEDAASSGTLACDLVEPSMRRRTAARASASSAGASLLRAEANAAPAAAPPLPPLTHPSALGLRPWGSPSVPQGRSVD